MDGIILEISFPNFRQNVGSLLRKCRKGEVDDIKKMMTKFGPRAIVNAKNHNQATCLHVAAAKDQPEIITLLFENGANLESEDKNGDTPLRRAIRERKYSSVEVLVKLGASLEKAKESKNLESAFNSGLEDERTKAAVAEGKRLAGESKFYKTRLRV